MATGGGTADHLHCSVCLEHYKGRNPRLLSCHHSFCEGCLKELVKQGQISCPSCREMTAVKDGDVTNLTMNFHLLPFLEETRSFGKKCQFCNLSVAVLKCEECIQIMCQDCSESHSKVKRFKDHHVLKLCFMHYEGVSQICLQCVKPVCFKCLVLEHQEHEDRVVSHEEGIKKLRENIKKTSDQLEKNLNDIDKIMKEDKIKLKEAEYVVSKCRSRKEEHEKKVQEANNMIEEVQQCYSNKDDIVKEQERVAQSARKIAEEVHKLQLSSDEEMLHHYKECIKLEEGHSAKYLQVSDIRRVPSVYKKITDINTNKTLKMKPEQVAIIRSSETLKMEEITSGTTIWENSIIIADHQSDTVTQVNQHGEIECVFPIQEEYGNVLDVCIHGSSLYIGQTQGVSQIVDMDSHKLSIRKCKMEETTIGGMCVVSYTKILYTDYENGKVYQFDPHEQSTKMVLEGLNNPTYINVMINDAGIKYIVTSEKDNCLKVYNNHWEYDCTIGKGEGSEEGYLDNPTDCVCTNEGILVVDCFNDRICLFDFAGQFVSNYLTKDDGIEAPNGLAYRLPYLWVMCDKSVFCYKVH